MSNIKLSFSTNAYKKLDLLDAIQSIKEIGYQGIEIMCDIPHAYPPDLDILRIMQIDQALKTSKLNLANLNSFMLFAVGDTWHPSFIERQERERVKRIEHTLNCIDLAVKLGAPSISIEPGGPLNGVPVDWALAVFHEAVEAIGKYAEERNVSVLIEPEPGLLIETSYQYLSFMEKVTSPAIGLNFDIGHFYCVGEDIPAIIHSLKDYTRHYHLEDIASSRVHHHLLPGDGAINFHKVLGAISDTGYDGFVTVELYPYAENPAFAAQKAFEQIMPLIQMLSKKQVSIHG